MKTISIFDIGRPLTSVVALGYFDGMHLGHQAVLGRTVMEADKLDCLPCAFTFNMWQARPASKTAGDIMKPRDRNAAMRSHGARVTVTADFAEVMSMSGEEFVREDLVKWAAGGGICCGTDFRFGAGRSCGAKELEELCARHNLKLFLVDPVMYEGLPISSTRIKDELGRGNMEAVNSMLGRAYSHRLVVVRERQLATKLGFPTINQRYPDSLACPRFGVYHTRATIDGKEYASVSNIGRRPTVEGGDVRTVLETHVLDYTGNLYRRPIEVALLHFIRDERRFDSIEELRDAIAADVMKVRALT